MKGLNVPKLGNPPTVNTGFGGTSAFGGGGSGTPATTTFGGFGTANKTPFGQQPGAAATPGFGAQTPAAGGFGGFGTQATPVAGGTTGLGGFGASTGAANAGGGGFGFGGFNKTNTSPPSLGGGGFGTSFGTGNAFGGGGGGFGGFGGAPGGGNMMGGNAMGGGFGQPPAPTLLDKFTEMQGYWDPKNPNCQFKTNMADIQHYFYNMVHPSEVQFYKCPPNEDPTLYQQAVQDNPDPSCMVPVLAVGFDDIKKRIKQQDLANESHRARLSDSIAQLEKIERKHYLETTVKLDEYKRRHTELAQRTLKLMKVVQILRNKGYPIRADEEALRSRLEAMDLQLKKPAHFRGRIQELQATLRMLKDSRRLGFSDAKDGETVAYEIGNEDQMRLIGEALQTSQEGLMKLTDVLEEDTRHMDIVSKVLARIKQKGIGLAHILWILAVLIFGIYELYTATPWARRSMLSNAATFQTSLLDPISVDIDESPSYCQQTGTMNNMTRPCLYLSASDTSRYDSGQLMIELGRVETVIPLSAVKNCKIVDGKPLSNDCVVKDEWRNGTQMSYYISGVESMYIGLRHSLMIPKRRSSVFVSNTQTNGKLDAGSSATYFDRIGRVDDRISVGTLLKAAGISSLDDMKNGVMARDSGIRILVNVDYYGYDINTPSDISYTYTASIVDSNPIPERQTIFNQTAITVVSISSITLIFRSTATWDDPDPLNFVMAIAAFAFLIFFGRALFFIFLVCLSRRSERHKEVIFRSIVENHDDEISLSLSAHLSSHMPKPPNLGLANRDRNTSADTLSRQEDFSFDPSIAENNTAVIHVEDAVSPVAVHRIFNQEETGSRKTFMTGRSQAASSGADVAVQEAPAVARESTLRGTQVSVTERDQIRLIMEDAQHRQQQEQEQQQNGFMIVSNVPASGFLPNTSALVEQMYLHQIQASMGINPLDGVGHPPPPPVTASRKGSSESTASVANSNWNHPLSRQRQMRKGGNLDRWPSAALGQHAYRQKQQIQASASLPLTLQSPPMSSHSLPTNPAAPHADSPAKDRHCQPPRDHHTKTLTKEQKSKALK
ncbi:hypothetical protein HDU97_008696 [Phlyctochytrium planicorne]|nr:hypothetical protein HDU97_008696 [Phlyctochytrium planicorne]